MKLFCSIAMTGEDEKELVGRVQLVKSGLAAAGHEMYCQALDPHVDKVKAGGVKAVLVYAFEKLAACDGVVAVVTSERKSEGQLMEIGVALAASKPIFLFVHQSARDVPSHLPEIADKVFYWQTDEELRTVLARLGS